MAIEYNSVLSTPERRGVSIEQRLAEIDSEMDQLAGLLTTPRRQPPPQFGSSPTRETLTTYRQEKLTPVNKILSSHNESILFEKDDVTSLMSSILLSGKDDVNLTRENQSSNQRVESQNLSDREVSPQIVNSISQFESESTHFDGSVLKESNIGAFSERTSLVAQAGRTPARPTKLRQVPQKPTVVPRSSIPAKRPRPTSSSGQDNDRSPQLPLLEQLRKLNSKLPERFRVHPTNRKFSPPPRRLTRPVSPKLRTSIRCKVHPQPLPTPAPQPFRARPVNPRILSSKGNLGVPRIAKNKPTIARSPRFSQPRPRSTTSKQVKSSHPPLPVPRRKPTVIQPFTFATDRIAEFKRSELERKLQLQKQEEERKRQFKARPMPTFTPEQPRPKLQRPSTTPQAFSFMSEARVEYHRQLRSNKAPSESRPPPPFRARPVPKFPTNQVLRVSSRPPTKPRPFRLHSEIRSEQRREYEQQRQHKLAEEQRQRELERQRQEECDQAQLRRLRSRLVPKAQPMPKFQFFQVKRSTKPLTEPRSPNIGKRRRLV